MHQLLTGQTRERLHQELVLRVPEDEIHGHARRLLLAVGVIEEERRNFNTARSKEKVQLEEERRTAKRKHDAEVEEQRVYNREIKGEVRKKFKAALAVTAARDPVAERAKATAKAAIASVLATYKDKAAV